MIRALVILLTAMTSQIPPLTAVQRYEPSWASLDTRPLPKWYDDAKFGIFVHWGVYSVPSFGDEWFWQYWRGNKYPQYVNFMRRNYPPGFTYADFAADFTAEFFDADRWAELFEAAGARYVVLTTKHHEGFTLWPSKYAWNWNAVDTGPARDLVQELAAAVRRTKHVRFGVYHSLFEWFNPLWLSDKASNFTERQFPTHKTIPELYELVENYKPDVIWSDGSIMARGGSDYWGSRQFIAWLYNDSPVRQTAVVNDRWGADAGCKHGDFFTCRDRYQPGHLLPHKWENCMTIDRHSWGYRRDATLADMLSTKELLQQLVETVSCGGNLLLNVGPTHDGRIVPIFEERLRQIGSWLSVNGAAIYGSRPWHHQNDTLTSGVWYTSANDTTVYASVFDWPQHEELRLGSVKLAKSQGAILLLGHDRPLSWNQVGNGTLQVRFPSRSSVNTDWVWVLEIRHAQPAVKQGDSRTPLEIPFTEFSESENHAHMEY